MRMKMVCNDRTLRDVANEFLALKKAQKVRERTLSDYKKYIDKFLAQSQNTLDVDVLKLEILSCDFFSREQKKHASGNSFGLPEVFCYGPCQYKTLHNIANIRFSLSLCFMVVNANLSRYR